MFVFYLYILLFLGLNIYPAFRTCWWIGLFADVNPVLFGIVFVWFPLSSVAVFYGHKFPKNLKKVLDWVGGIYMLVFLFSWVFWAVFDIIRLVLTANGEDTLLYSKAGGAVVIGLTAIIILWGFCNYSKLKVTHYDIALGKPLKKKVRAVLLSDIHLGTVNSEKRLKEIVALTSEQRPDIVFIAGDLFNNNFDAIPDPDADAKVLSSIDAPLGVYACLGNHDAGRTYEKMRDFLPKASIRLLNDEAVLIDDNFTLLGRIDPMPIGGFAPDVRRAPLSDIRIDHEHPVIVLEHNPATYKEYDGSFELMLSGHTHAGQMFPANLVTRAMYTVHYGFLPATSSSPAVVVSSGAGVWAMPFRTSSSCEVVVIDLE